MAADASLFLVVLSAVLYVTNGVKVSVFYEALCSDSVKFIDRQLYPHYSEIAKYVDLDLVPYGKAAHSKANETWEFLCQHGPSECKGNKYQSCVLSLKSGSETDVNVVKCIMKSRHPAYFVNVEKCAKKFNLDVEKLKLCSISQEGDNLLAINGDKTPPIAFVPTVVYDGIFNQQDQDQSLVDFVAVVCSKINGIKPSICDNRPLPKTWGWY